MSPPFMSQWIKKRSQLLRPGSQYKKKGPDLAPVSSLGGNYLLQFHSSHHSPPPFSSHQPQMASKSNKHAKIIAQSKSFRICYITHCAGKSYIWKVYYLHSKPQWYLLFDVVFLKHPQSTCRKRLIVLMHKALGNIEIWAMLQENNMSCRCAPFNNTG